MLPCSRAEQGSKVAGADVLAIDELEGCEIGDEEGAGVRGQHTSRGIKAGPRMGLAPVGCAYPRTRKSRDVSPVSDGIRRLTTRRASQLATCGAGPM